MKSSPEKLPASGIRVGPEGTPGSANSTPRKGFLPPPPGGGGLLSAHAGGKTLPAGHEPARAGPDGKGGVCGMTVRLWERANLAYWRWRRDQRGQALTEYGLILALVAIAVIVILGTLGGKLQALFQRISDSINL